MSAADVRASWLKYCDEVVNAAGKDPNSALARIAEKYQQLPQEDRVIVDRLLVEQLQANELVPGAPWYEGENARFIPEFLIDEFRIVAALPVLRVLGNWLESQDTPGAPYEWAKVNRLIGKLVEHPNGA